MDLKGTLHETQSLVGDLSVGETRKDFWYEQGKKDVANEILGGAS